MKAFIITLMNDAWSLSYAERRLQSIQDTESEIEATLFDATTPQTIFLLRGLGLQVRKLLVQKQIYFSNLTKLMTITNV